MNEPALGRPALQPRFTFAAATACRSWKAPAGARSLGDHRVDQSSEVVSRYLSLAWASGAASRRLSCVVSALGYEAVGIAHSLLATEHVGTPWSQKRGELRHVCRTG